VQIALDDSTLLNVRILETELGAIAGTLGNGTWGYT
jgi:hypothetical protein